MSNVKSCRFRTDLRRNIRRVLLPAVLFAAFVVVVSQPGSLFAAEQYDLRIPGNRTFSSRCVVDEQKLTLIDKRGGAFDYVREQAMDGKDGQTRAYWSARASQYLRWPISNTGSLQIGRRSGGTVSWRASQMQIFPIEGAEPSDTGTAAELPVQRLHRVASTRSPDDLQFAAQVDSNGLLQFYQRADTQWRHRPALSGADLGRDAPIWMGWSDTRQQPVIYSIDQQGILFSIHGGTRTSLHRDQNVRFDRSGQLRVSKRGDRQAGMIVDRNGRLWEVDLQTGDFVSIDSQENRFLPNTQLSMARSPADQLFAIDRKGDMISYEMLASGWSAPTRVGSRFSPGASLHAAANADAAYVASIDREGIARLLARRDGRWNPIEPPRQRFAPGAPIALHYGASNNRSAVSISGIDPRGDWYALNYDPSGGSWDQALLGTGFDPHVSPDFQGRHAFALDRRGRLIAAEPFDRGRRLSLLSPRYPVAPVIRTRSVRENPQLPPARVTFRNTSDEELLVKLYDTRTDVKVNEFRIPARGDDVQTLQRYSGATVEESLLVTDPYGNVRSETQRFNVPAQNVYHIVVWVNRVTSVFYDRVRNKGPIPDKTGKSLVSLGVFPLPAGPDLADGLVLDVIGISKEQRNPGAAGIFK